MPTDIAFFYERLSLRFGEKIVGFKILYQAFVQNFLKNLRFSTKPEVLPRFRLKTSVVLEKKLSGHTQY